MSQLTSEVYWRLPLLLRQHTKGRQHLQGPTCSRKGRGRHCASLAVRNLALQCHSDLATGRSLDERLWTRVVSHERGQTEEHRGGRNQAAPVRMQVESQGFLAGSGSRAQGGHRQDTGVLAFTSILSMSYVLCW